jgi:hypothetical protein
MLRQRFGPVLAAACVGGALLAPGVALAATPSVTFQGGCGLLGVGASSHPDSGAVSVRSGATVNFVNHLGQPAHLMINGADRGIVPKDNQIAVLFRQGRVSVAMLPGCLLRGGDVGSVSVSVTSAPGTGSPAAPGSPAGHTGTGRSPEARIAASASPAPSGMAASADPAAPAPDGGGAVPSTDAWAPAAAGSVPVSDSVAVGTAVPAPPGRRGPAGLLVFTAAICVVGVSVAATRAIISQRAIRAIAT